MREVVVSQHGEEFRHDAEAEGYDLNALNEGDPIRMGYAGALSWVAGTAASRSLRRSAR